ncbi:reverse transcriptase domain-containing protein [Tanacetum coccineum]
MVAVCRTIPRKLCSPPRAKEPTGEANAHHVPMAILQVGIDIAGPFSKGPDKVKFLIVAMDYFTKWIEAKPVATITGAQIKKIIWDNVVCRFGLPGEIVSDNEKQFRDNPFKDWSKKTKYLPMLCFRQTSPNQRLGRKGKKKFRGRNQGTTSNGETPFSLTYGTEAVIPVEISMPTLRTAKVDMIKNNEDLGINLDLLEEKREQAAIQEARSKAKMEKYYNAKVRSISFRPGDFVYRNNEASHAEDGGKLGPKWEGPYEVTEALGRGAYKLRDRNGNTLPRTWNVCNLKKCYMHGM